jgi:hypothetical protein
MLLTCCLLGLPNSLMRLRGWALSLAISLRGDIVFEALSARQSLAAKIPFLAVHRPWKIANLRKILDTTV